MRKLFCTGLQSFFSVVIQNQDERKELFYLPTTIPLSFAIKEYYLISHFLSPHP